MADTGNVVWMDLEMTGIEPDNSKIIEVGIIITDWDLNEITTYEQIVRQDDATLAAADPWVKKNMKSLLNQVPDGTPEPDVIQDIVKLIDEHCDLDQPLYLAGNSIHQDRRFIRAYWPQVEAKLHYRMLDVSAWKIVMSHKFDVQFTKREQHRALEDIRGSIEEFTLYLKQMDS